MKNQIFTIVDNELLAPRVYRMHLAGDVTGIKAGQFVDISLAGRFLRRPISVCDAQDGVLTIIYKVVGAGTADMSGLKAGDTLDVLTQLGNGYNLARAGETPLLVGGGVGVPPLYMAARLLREQGKAVRVILGFNTEDEVFYEDAFKALGCEVTVTTADGSYGVKGFVTAALDDKQSYYYACGPLPMLKALVGAAGNNGQISMEERMGCGFGICVGCSMQTKNGIKRVCKEGPVFSADEIEW